MSDSNSQEEQHVQELKERRKSMKINTIGLDISEVK